MKVCIIILLGGAPLFCQSSGIISGTITNSSGDRISEVKVCIESLGCILSDTDGYYEMEMYSLDRFIRFSSPGYNSSIKNIYAPDDLGKRNVQVDVILQKSTKESDDKLTIPNCTENDNLVGFRYKTIISTPNIIKSNGSDSDMIAISSTKNEEEYLQLWSDGNMSLASLPPWRMFPSPEEWSVIYDRDVEYEDQLKTERGIPVALMIDIKVQSGNEKFWRYIGTTGNTIFYNNVSKETAREFDDILETLCYSPPERDVLGWKSGGR